MSDGARDRENRQQVQRQFGANAQRYVTSTDHAHSDSRDRLLELAAPQRDWQALDVATGGGHTALAFGPHVRMVVASDLTIEMLGAARRFIQQQGQSNVIFAAADAGALPFADASFDLVTCRVAPHHFADVARFVDETARVLKPGAVAAMVDNVVPEDNAAADYINALEKFRDPSHTRALAASEWLELFAHAGLDMTHAETFRKSRDLDYWCDTQAVNASVRSGLRRMLIEAPPAARAALAPLEKAGKVTFFLTELLLIAVRRGPGSHR